MDVNGKSKTEELQQPQSIHLLHQKVGYRNQFKIVAEPTNRQTPFGISFANLSDLEDWF